MIDHSRQIIFVHVTRTGGTSVEMALAGKDQWLIDSNTKHISASQARSLYGERVWNTYTKFGIVRNPWDRACSMWATKWWHQASRLNENCPFEEFLKKLKPHPSEKYNSLLCSDVYNEEMDYVLRFESLGTDFANMLKDIGVTDVNLPHFERRVRKHYTTMYKDSEKAIVAELFERDIQQYGYSFK